MIHLVGGKFMTGILILSADASEYLPLLQPLADSGVEITVAETADLARERYTGQEVLLAQPDMAAQVLTEMHEIRWIQSTWAGVTPLLNSGRSDYLLTGVKNTFGPEIAEYVLGYLLAHEIRMLERLGRQANHSWCDQPSGSLQGKSLGIMGTGSIGSYIASMARPFGVSVTGFSRTGRPVAGFDRVCAADQLAEFLAEPDYLVCVLPDTPDTRGLLDADAFRAMKPNCLLINVGRGTILDEQALVQALFAGELAGAVLDVFCNEPLPPQSPLWNAPGLIVTGHVAARSWPRDIAAIFRKNFRRYCAGEALEYPVDFERGY
jgi:phosphoglycerate dehydrogenase-like enzyme